jgi:AraC-like DNA-binding protein
MQTMHLANPAPANQNTAVPENPDNGVTALRAGSIALRHQSPRSLSLRGSERLPLVFYLFSPTVRPTAGELVPAGSFSIMPAGTAVNLHFPEPLEVLAIACNDLEPFRSDEPAIGLVDAGVRSAAVELRRVLLREPTADLGYVEDLGRAMVRRAFAMAAPAASARREQLAPAKLRRVLDYIALRLGEPLPVEELAAVADLSPAHFARAFRAATGESPHRYLINQRLQSVRAELEGGRPDLAILAAEYGFSSHAHLSRAFAQAFGVPPGVYRRMTTRAA